MRYLFLVFCLLFFFNSICQNNLVAGNPSADSTTTPLLQCNNWLNTPSYQSYVDIGDLDITGNRLTVEAIINRTEPYMPGTGNNSDGDIVSKHLGPASINYLLRPNHAYITTTNGFFATPDFCEIELNKTYHVAMVYDGISLKYYRNGYLMSQIAASGNLFQNDLVTRIGSFTGTTIENFLGYINEVRIWNIPRTQAEIRAFMNIPLTSPSTQSGLLAYYTFDNLQNKQGNSAWNGVLNGSAIINTTNPECILIADSCEILNNVSNIINDYTPVLGLDICKNAISVEDGSAFHVGDTVLLIQMKGAVIDSTNTAAFGNILNYQNAGNYEYNYVSDVTGNEIDLRNKLTRLYNIPSGKVQLIRVPYYATMTVNETLTCLTWDGSKGGVLAFNVADTLILNADMNVSGKGFQGGEGNNTLINSSNCGQSNYIYPSVSTLAALKGENISNLLPDKASGRGAPSNGGGGGQDHNSGGGGGSNGSVGGFGGYQWSDCANMPYDNRGLGGKALTYSNAQNKIFLGGGGGAGHCNNLGFNSTGGNGGGIIIFKAKKIINNAKKIISNGDDAASCIPNGSFGYCHEGMGGGGAGGTILIDLQSSVDNASIILSGGKGGNMSGENAGEIGPGGGGSGGVLWVNQSSIPANFNILSPGGLNGINVNISNNPWGATPGGAGITNTGLVLPVDIIPFKPNIDSVQINYNGVSCNAFSFQGLGFTNTTPVTSWHWNFGDGNNATTQNVTHVYLTSGNYNVELIINDINGCADTTYQPVSTSLPTANAGSDAAFCSNGSISHMLNGTVTGTGFVWTPAAMLDNSSIANPTATVSSTTTFYLTTTNGTGCSAIDTVTITVNPVPVVSTINNIAICEGEVLQLTTSGATSYQWLPATSVSNPSISNPYFNGNTSQEIIVTGYIGTCSANDTVYITVKPLPVITTIPDSAICGNVNITLTTTGADTYSWSPSTGLSNPDISNPVFTGSSSQTYYVTGTGTNACSAADTVTITVNIQPSILTINDISICRGDSLQLISSSNFQTVQWSPPLSVDNPGIINPYFIDTISQMLIVTAANGICIAKDTVTITVKTLPVIETISDSSLCGPQNIILNTSGGTTYSWSPATGLSDPNISNPVFAGTTTQTYYVTGTASNACKGIDSVTITINTIPFITTINNAGICSSDTLYLTTNSNADLIQWLPATSVSDPASANPYFIGAGTQQLIVNAINNTGCRASDTVIITVKPSPVVRTINDTTNCSVNSITLLTTGANTYSWTPANNLSDPSIASPVFTGPGSFTYYVTGTAANGCFAKDTVNVTITSKPVFNKPLSTVPICEKDSVQLNADNGIQYIYTWSPQNYLSDPDISDPISHAPVTTIYTVIIRDNNCNYDSTFIVQVIVNPLPVLTAASSNDLNCIIGQTQLTVNGASTYAWYPTAHLNNSNINNPVASPIRTTEYIVTGSSIEGCINSDTVLVQVKGGKFMGNIPNAFTPNGDGINDCFGTSYWSESKDFHLLVYNRWGQKVFETNKVSDCWNGMFKGQPSDAGNYVYIVNGTTLCGALSLKGNVLLIR